MIQSYTFVEAYEVAADYFGDYIIWFLQPGFKESEFQKTKIWETIPAVKENRVQPVKCNFLS